METDVLGVIFDDKDRVLLVKYANKPDINELRDYNFISNHIKKWIQKARMLG